MTDPQITIKPYYHTGAIDTPHLGKCTITVTRVTDTSNPIDQFHGSVQCKGQEAHTNHFLDGNAAALLCHSWVTIHGFDVDCTCFPPTNSNTISSTDC
jgi:hypothetical protein